LAEAELLLGAPSPAVADADADPPSNYEASVVATVHTQAAGVQNIRSLVPVYLDTTFSAYARWRDLFLLTLQHYALDDHVLTDRSSTALSWFRMDSFVLSWILGTLTVELQDIVREAGGTARQAWIALESQFWGNRETRALHLDAAFRSFT